MASVVHACVIFGLLCLASAPARSSSTTYIVPAGTSLTLELLTAASSATSRKGDQVTANLLDPIMRGEAELVPAGSKIYGTVSEVESHGGSRPGRVALRFHVVEHLVTGSRAAIRTGPVTAEGELRKERKFGVPITRGAPAAIQAGAIASVTLEEPLRVVIPKK
jgi:hypothetical protein